MKKILITGKNSYIGTKFEKSANQNYDWQIDTLDMLDENWRNTDFSKYDVVYHVAGIAHNSNDKSMDDLYFKVNRDLAIEVAEISKKSGVKQFIFMSSMIIYGKDFPVGKVKIINSNTIPTPENAYGESKRDADMAIQKMNSNEFKTVVIRTPMVYGEDCKGNYPKLQKLALKLPIIPELHNKRSCIEINLLVTKISEYINNEECGVMYPQDEHYFNTFEIMKNARLNAGKKVHKTKIFNPLIKICSRFNNTLRKIWGSKIYDIKQ